LPFFLPCVTIGVPLPLELSGLFSPPHKHSSLQGPSFFSCGNRYPCGKKGPSPEEWFSFLFSFLLFLISVKPFFLEPGAREKSPFFRRFFFQLIDRTLFSKEGLGFFFPDSFFFLQNFLFFFLFVRPNPSLTGNFLTRKCFFENFPPSLR